MHYLQKQYDENHVRLSSNRDNHFSVNIDRIREANRDLNQFIVVLEFCYYSFQRTSYDLFESMFVHEHQQMLYPDVIYIRDVLYFEYV